MQHKSNKPKKIAVLLAGSGRGDGSEIHESVLTLLSITQDGAQYQCFSLNQPQHHVTNHLTNENNTNHAMSRNMLVESARIARGDVKDLTTIDVTLYDALIIPGGNGVAYNLFTLAIEGKDFKVNQTVINTCLAFTNAKKPVGFICISPAMIPIIYKDMQIELTIGNDKETVKLLTDLGARHFNCEADAIHIDKKHKIITTPAYMLAKDIDTVYTGIKKLVMAVLEYTHSS